MWDPSGTLRKTENLDVDPSGTLEKPKNQNPSGTLRKPKQRDMVPQWETKTGKAGPNVTLEKPYKCSLLLSVSSRKRQNNLENKTSNTLILFNLITIVSILKGHL